jgi:hypothetical protein
MLKEAFLNYGVAARGCQPKRTAYLVSDQSNDSNPPADKPQLERHFRMGHRPAATQ